MLKKFKILMVRGINALKLRKNTPSTHIAFKRWIENHPEYTNLVYMHGSDLFNRSINGKYDITALRLAFDLFEANPKRGVSFYFWTRVRKEFLKHFLVSAAVGVFILALLLKGYNVY